MMKRSIWQNICGYFQPGQETVNLDHPQRLRLSGKKLRIPLNGYPVYRIEMGKQTLILSPDLGVVASDNEPPCDFILFDPERYLDGIAHFQKLSPGSTLTSPFFSHPRRRQPGFQGPDIGTRHLYFT
jgi:hypothetical protein